MVYYKLYTTFISSNVTWSRHDVTGKLLIWYKTTIIHSNQLSKGWIISYSRFNCLTLSHSSQTTVFTHLKYFHQSMDETVMFCFYFNHWFCKDDLTFARHINIQITNMTHGYKHCRSTRYGWYGSDRTTVFGWYGKPYHNLDRKK